ncbi:MAG: formate dehydrogenase accessory sulfurtransferase FdhD [Woeseia sp.]
MSGSSLAIEVSRVHGEHRFDEADSVAVEEPLEIQLCWPTAEGSAAKSISITMRTPGDDAELAIGFLYSEAIIASASQIAAVSHAGPVDPNNGLQNVIRVELAAAVDIDLSRLERHFYTTSSCGVCGKASLDALRVTGLQSLRRISTPFSQSIIESMPDKLREQQAIFSKTGGLHAAAVFSPDGEIVLVREDVGRHNALDKVIGALLMDGRLPAHTLGLLVSGRASFELMQKALVAGLPLLAAVGAPSSLAVQLALEFDMTLIGFLRRGKFNIYAGANRLTDSLATSSTD